MIPVHKIVKAYRQYTGAGQEEWARRCGIRPLSVYVAWERGEIRSEEYAVAAMRQIPDEISLDPNNAPTAMKAIAIRLVYGDIIFTYDAVDSIGIKYGHYLRCLNGTCQFSADAARRIDRIFERAMRD